MYNENYVIFKGTKDGVTVIFSRKWMNKTLRMHPFTKCWTAVG